ncbi:helix-turn-helix domain-containing protein [Tissierella praeacuta]|uniref:helix-turn-helix domain-containing protein n=1 Tax=Tissierella praeacuta TaxID=43131 RepID=UPI003DA21511
MTVSYNKLKKLLIDANKGISDLGKELGINKNTLTKINKNEYISLRTLEIIANHLDCDIGDLVEIQK